MRRKHHRREEEAEINMTPMLDMTFIMLIFFIVTTSFVNETGIDVSRPSSAPPQTQKQESKIVLVRIMNDGTIQMDDRQIDLGSVRANVERAVAVKPDATVVVVSGKGSHAGILVSVIDQIRRAGVNKVSIATTGS